MKRLGAFPFFSPPNSSLTPLSKREGTARMAWTQADVDKLKAAIATGARRVQYRDQLVEYNSLTDMITALKMMEAEVAGGAANTTSRASYATFSKGY